MKNDKSTTPGVDIILHTKMPFPRDGRLSSCWLRERPYVLDFRFEYLLQIDNRTHVVKINRVGLLKTGA